MEQTTFAQDDHRRIRRIAAPASGDLPESWLTGQTPLVIEGLFAGQPIDALRTIELVAQALGHVGLAVSQEYTHNDYESQRDGSDVPDRHMSLGDYLAFVEREPSTPWMCAEQRTPEEVRALYTEPRAVGFRAAEGDTVDRFFFLGNRSNHANFHFDGDFRPVLLHQVAGRKRAFLAPPEAAPLMGPMKNFSAWLFHAFSEDQKRDFMSLIGGSWEMLSPGDTLLIPVGYWHHLEYIDTAVSFNLRLRRNRFLQILGSGKVHLSYKSQAIAARLNRPDAEGVAAFEPIAEALSAEDLSPEDRFERVERAFDAAYRALMPARAKRALTAHLIPTPEVALWKSRLRAGKLYPARIPLAT